MHFNNAKAEVFLIETFSSSPISRFCKNSEQSEWQFFPRVPLCPPHYGKSSSGTTAPPAASSTKENEVCTICYDNPMDIALGCKNRFWCPICLANPKGMALRCGYQTCSNVDVTFSHAQNVEVLGPQCSCTNNSSSSL
ncbi:E3 ubiquitin-protein ligase RGLG2-like [Pyrus ussuriensis x Pyrus communis]|uniref:E3 ubiquitin-protein ligase RGLG2-like n=1 Tax=Pyrus ussuriensis x Pyrus communis TaxID=2448454 RepID=A0A5N5I7H9_9ROSA|nr:E3 ubiquitin-protein ligase RGLG2-like [Pyrus ussuriensis x Pyrus communis]